LVIERTADGFFEVSGTYQWKKNIYCPKDRLISKLDDLGTFYSVIGFYDSERYHLKFKIDLHFQGQTLISRYKFEGFRFNSYYHFAVKLDRLLMLRGHDRLKTVGLMSRIPIQRQENLFIFLMREVIERTAKPNFSQILDLLSRGIGNIIFFNLEFSNKMRDRDQF